MELKKIIDKLKIHPNVIAICLGGSRATGMNDEKSDYDVYVYYKEPITLNKRQEILNSNCRHMEIGVNYFEEEDDCILNNGIVIELIYRNFDHFKNAIEELISNHNANLGYTTCFLDNILNAKVLFDREGLYQKMVKQIIIYPEDLRQNIIKKNMSMLHGVIASYDTQIIKAYNRGDMVSVNHRIAAYLSSYFDVIFAINKIYHPGEKRLIEHVKNKCSLIPMDFEQNINSLLNLENLETTLANIYNNLCLLID